MNVKHFKAQVRTEGSWGVGPLSKEAEHTMTLSKTSEGTYLIEWVCKELEVVEQIGIWVEDGELTDYDGVMKEAAELLRENGIEVSDDFL